MFKVFTRTFWKENKSYPNNLEPCLGRKYTLDTVSTEGEAQKICKDYNESHKPGRYSKKAEYQKV